MRWLIHYTRCFFHHARKLSRYTQCQFLARPFLVIRGAFFIMCGGFFIPWSQRLSFNIIFFHLEICDAKHWSKRRVGRKRKPLVATVANLTFMLAQHLTAVKDVIFFWPITKGDRIYNLLTGLGGSVLQYLEINYFVGRGEERLLCLQAAFQGLVFIPKRDKLLLWHLKWKGKT